MAFRVGQKVVCIDNGMGAMDASPYLQKGDVYTVTASRIDLVGWPVIGLAGVRYQWSAERFRPIVERKTDISIFTAMLNPSLEDVASVILHEVT
jgi:hypothetical protein